MEMTQNVGVSMRRVTAAEKETVLKLRGDVHSGMDFLESYFDYFLASPRMYPAAVFKDGKMAGFSLVDIVDGGQTAVIRGSRVSPDFEKQGLMKMLFHHTKDWAQKMGVGSILAMVGEMWWNRTGFYTRSLTELHIDVNRVRIPPTDVGLAAELATISDPQLKDILNDTTTRDYIAPKGILLVNMMPLKPLEANISCIRGIEGSTEIYSDVKCGTKDVKGLLSCRTTFPAPRGSISSKICFIDIFGDDPSSLRKHLTRHLIDISSTSACMVGLNVLIPECFSTNSIQEVLKDVNVKDEGVVYSANSGMYVVESWRRNDCSKS